MKYFAELWNSGAPSPSRSASRPSAMCPLSARRIWPPRTRTRLRRCTALAMPTLHPSGHRGLKFILTFIVVYVFFSVSSPLDLSLSIGLAYMAALSCSLDRALSAPPSWLTSSHCTGCSGRAPSSAGCAAPSDSSSSSTCAAAWRSQCGAVRI